MSPDTLHRARSLKKSRASATRSCHGNLRWRTTMKITRKMLEDAGACQGEINRLVKLYAAHPEIKRQEVQLYAEYQRQEAPLWAAYQRQVAILFGKLLK
mgnify:CR=1 FL=1